MEKIKNKLKMVHINSSQKSDLQSKRLKNEACDFSIKEKMKNIAQNEIMTYVEVSYGII